MPTTSLSGWSFANHGPLTTTFTAPTSCFTSTDRLQLGAVITDDSNMTSVVPFLGLCGTTVPYWASVGDCVPSGQAIDSQYKTINFTDPTAGFVIDYYSPGLFCPSGYKTVGVGANSAGTITSSGEGFVPTTTLDDSYAVYNPLPNVLLEGLDVGETAILCCPNSYQVDLYGDCYSTLPSYPVPTEACYNDLPAEDVTTITTTVSIFGTAVTNGVLQIVSSVPINGTSTTTLDSTETYTVLSMAPMITLVHNAADATAKPKSDAPGRAEISNKLVLLLSCWVFTITTGFLSSAL